MITIVSPAMNMNPAKAVTPPHSVPHFIDSAKTILEVLKDYTPWDLQAIMKLNESLALDSADRNRNIKTDQNGYSAIEVYDGIQYKYIKPETFNSDDIGFSQKHIRILSGLYGVLKPYDSIYEYRLEMQTKIPVQEHKTLYSYWGSQLYEHLMTEDRTIINLASAEYSKCIKKYLNPGDRFITCTFKVRHQGKYKTLATAAKMARGEMVRFIAKNKITSPEDLKLFDAGDYVYEPSISNETEFIFLR